LAQLPVLDKAKMMANFDALNTRGVSREAAMSVALRAEQARDFAPLLGDLTVGLSSGTSGHRGLFLVSPAERARWAGIMLAKALPESLLREMFFGKLSVLRIAFFLRANSNLYTTLKRRRMDFAFYDLWEDFVALVARLDAQLPHLLVAPAYVLRLLAEAQRNGKLAIRPRKIFSVAEVLEPADEQFISATFNQPVAQIYQCTEGFLGITCARGTLHLNEEFVHIEPQWLDVERTRFVPLVTDFSRTTQLIVRYRLDDVLHVAPPVCACGNPALALAAIEGRADDVLSFRARSSDELKPIFPDFMRRAFLFASEAIREYQVTQRGERLEVAWQLNEGANEAALQERLRVELAALCAQTETMLPELAFVAFQPQPLHAKRRRVKAERGASAT
jgi:putative adenylate-forming enzyme